MLGFDRLRARLLHSFVSRWPSLEGAQAIACDVDEKWCSLSEDGEVVYLYSKGTKMAYIYLIEGRIPLL